MKDYTCKCPNCLKKKNRINDYFCIKNTGYCEHCLADKKNKETTDYWSKYRPKQLSTTKGI